MMQLTYIYHDCFLLATDTATFIFDYWCDGVPLPGEKISYSYKAGKEPRFLSSIRRNLPLYVLVSHHHKDHFNKAVFRWKDAANEVYFILSDDTARSVRYILQSDSSYRGERPEASQVIVLKPGNEFCHNMVKINAFGSTDIGNCYMVKFDGQNVFHAGDLNAWIWKDESSEEEVSEAINQYINILDDIASRCGKRIDLAMFPVDSRLGTDYYEGAKIFVRQFDVGVFVPMHFGLGESREDASRKEADACCFDLYANPQRGIYAALTQPYSSLYLSFQNSVEN